MSACPTLALPSTMIEREMRLLKARQNVLLVARRVGCLIKHPGANHEEMGQLLRACSELYAAEMVK